MKLILKWLHPLYTSNVISFASRCTYQNVKILKTGCYKLRIMDRESPRPRKIRRVPCISKECCVQRESSVHCATVKADNDEPTDAPNGSSSLTEVVTPERLESRVGEQENSKHSPLFWSSSDSARSGLVPQVGSVSRPADTSKHCSSAPLSSDRMVNKICKTGRVSFLQPASASDWSSKCGLQGLQRSALHVDEFRNLDFSAMTGLARVFDCHYSSIALGT